MEGDYAEHTMVVMTATVVGLVVVMMWWLCYSCCRQMEFQKRLEVEKEALYRFLCDPHNLEIIHPRTSEIQIQEEREEEEGVTVTRFVWVEEVPFTVTSEVTMRCHPAKSTIDFDILPMGGMFKVQLTWRLETDHASSTDSNNDAGPHKTEDMATGSSGPTENDDHTGKREAMQPSTGREIITLFRNKISVTGPRAIVFLVATTTLKPVQLKLMDRLHQHFMDKSK